MPIIKYKIILILIIIFFSSCIERYYLEEQIAFTPKLVIDGVISDENEVQTIIISESTSAENPKFSPYSNCIVTVADDLGNIFNFSEKDGEPGIYHGIIDEQYFYEGSLFKLSIITPDGNQYESEFEEVLPCPPVDSVYYELERKPTYTPGVTEDGLQFYINLDASGDYGNFFRWVVDETYEYHSEWPIKAFIDSNNRWQQVPVDYSHYICYKTETLNNIFTLSTKGFTENSYNEYKLHFVNDHTQRLLYKYSILIHQYAISEQAYLYFENLKKNNQEEDNLFTKQPSIVKSNICNVNNPDEDVLGFFTVASATSTRIIIDSVKDLSFDKVEYCTATVIDAFLPPSPRPLYLVKTEDNEGNKAWGYANSECFDCTLKGGTTVKPDYWD